MKYIIESTKDGFKLTLDIGRMDRSVEQRSKHSPAARLFQHAERTWEELRHMELNLKARAVQKDNSIATDTPSKREARHKMLDKEKQHAKEQERGVQEMPGIPARLGQPEDARRR